MKVKIDQADKYFSLWIRKRDDWTCRRCLKRDEGGMQNSHYFGRSRESTRFDPLNCDTLCYGCHQYWGSTNREDYRQFKIMQLGEKGYDLLTLRANTYSKKDRKLQAILWKEKLKE